MANSAFTKSQIATPVSVPNGGTGLLTVTTGAIMAGNGTSALTVTGVTIDVTTNNLYGFSSKRNPQTGTTYTLQASDNGKIIELSNASAITLTLPNSLAADFNCLIVQTGAGQVTLSAAGGATLRNRSSFTKTAGQWAMLSMYVTTNAGGSSAVYILGGDGA